MKPDFRRNSSLHSRVNAYVFNTVSSIFCVRIINQLTAVRFVSDGANALVFAGFCRCDPCGRRGAGSAGLRLIFSNLLCLVPRKSSIRCPQNHLRHLVIGSQPVLPQSPSSPGMAPSAPTKKAHPKFLVSNGRFSHFEWRLTFEITVPKIQYGNKKRV